MNVAQEVGVSGGIVHANHQRPIVRTGASRAKKKILSSGLMI